MTLTAQTAAFGGDGGLASVLAPAGGLARPRLFVVDSHGRRHGYNLHGTVTLGRHPDNVIQLLDAGISKFHLRLSCRGEGAVLEDLGSHNGTLLNGEPVRQASLRDGDELCLGDIRLIFAVQRTAPGLLGPAVSMLPTRVGAASSVVTEIDSVEAGVEFPPAAQVGSTAQLGQAYERLRATYELMRAVASAEDLTALSSAILDHALEQFQVERGALLLLDQRGGEVTLAPLATRLRDGSGLGGEITVDREIVERLLNDRVGLISTGEETASLSVPLVVSDAVVGLLYLEARGGPDRFSARDLGLLSTVARPAALALANAQLVARVADDARERQALERFLSPTLVEQVRSRALGLGEAGRSREATILFADIRGFVSMAAPLEAEAVVAMLNEYFERAVEVVFEHHGVLDKFIGDAIMGVWGAVEPTVDHARQALRAAVDLCQAVVDLNEERVGRGEPPLEIGVGLASGRVVAGLVGAARRLEFTVVGDAVNLASRLCDQAGPGEVLCTEETLRGCADEFTLQDLGTRPIKGKPEPLRVLRIEPGQAERPA